MVYTFGKVFDSIFDSTLVADGGWLPTYVFMSMIVLADKDGIVDVARKALYRRLGFCDGKEEVSYQDFQSALDYLSQEDEESRSTENSGRRIIPLADLPDYDGNRGYKIVNYLYYRDKGRGAQRAADSTNRVRRFREKKHKNNDETLCNALKRGNTHTDTDTKAESGCASRFAPIDFEPSKEMQDWAISEGFLLAEISFETEKFKDYERPRRIKDWNRAWRNWMRKALQFRKEKVGETTPVTTADYAAKLGLSQHHGETEDKFVTRVRDAIIAQDYGSL